MYKENYLKPLQKALEDANIDQKRKKLFGSIVKLFLAETENEIEIDLTQKEWLAHMLENFIVIPYQQFEDSYFYTGNPQIMVSFPLEVMVDLITGELRPQDIYAEYDKSLIDLVNKNNPVHLNDNQRCAYFIYLLAVAFSGSVSVIEFYGLVKYEKDRLYWKNIFEIERKLCDRDIAWSSVYYHTAASSGLEFSHDYQLLYRFVNNLPDDYLFDEAIVRLTEKLREHQAGFELNRDLVTLCRYSMDLHEENKALLVENYNFHGLTRMPDYSQTFDDEFKENLYMLLAIHNSVFFNSEH